MKRRNAAVLKAATTITTTITDWVTDWLDASDIREALFMLTIVKGDATSFTFTIEEEDATGTTGFRTQKVSSGAASDDTVVVTAANLAATDYIGIPMSITRACRVRLKGIKTGGSGSPTVACKAIGGGL